MGVCSATRGGSRPLAGRGARRADKKVGGESDSRPPQRPRGSYFFFFEAFFLAAFFFAGIEVIPPFSPNLDGGSPLSTYRVSTSLAYYG